MLGTLSHTWAGAFLVHVLFVTSWTCGGVLVALCCAGMASHTAGLSFAIFGVVAMERLPARRAWSALCLVAYGCIGPRDAEAVSFCQFWISWASLLVMSLISWFWRFPGRPSFVAMIQDLDASGYYTKSELRGHLEDVEKEGSLFGFHPHGVMCIGFSLNGVWSKKFREHAGLATQFLVDKVLREDNPIFKVICDLHGGVESLSKRSIQENMAANRNVAFVPGGFEDATIMAFGKDRTAIKKRTGFIKYALQHGYRVHPVYTFGESNSYSTFTPLLRFRLWLNSLGIPGVIVWGLPLVPLLPKPDTSIVTQVGAAIKMPKIENPSREDVEKWHGVYCQELLRLFEQHKRSAGLPDTAELELW